MKKSKLRNKLMEGVVDVEFEKANGETRQMKATWDAHYIPEDERARLAESIVERKGDEEEKEQDPNLFRVWEVLSEDTGQWRSFKYERVTSINSEKL